jgi:serine/threonine-protein kinase
VLTARRALTFGGGIAVAECTDAGVRLVSWAPAQGYRVADVNSGPDKQVSVDFEGPDRTYAVKIVCVNGQPEASVGSD